MRFLSSRLTLTISVLTLVSCLSVASAREVQLAGIRLGDHAINLLDVYGTPKGIAVGEGQALSAAQAPGAAAGAPMLGAPGEPGLGGMMGMPGMGPGMPGMPGAMGPGMPGAAGPAMPGLEAVPGMGGPGAFPGAMPGMGAPGGAPGEVPGMAPGMPGMPGMGPGMGAPGMGGGPGGGAAAGGGGVQTTPFPVWALAVWVDLGPHEVEWVYQKGPVVLGFVLDRDGFVKVIAVAAEKCDFARTNLWRPHRYIKLGDGFKRVVYRYGYPDETVTFTSSGPGEASTGGGQVSVQFNGTTRTFSRDCIMRYTANNNIEFTLHDMTVTRIHIWE